MVGSFFQSSGKPTGPVVYSLDHPVTENPYPFELDANGSLLTSQLLDYEEKSSYVISIQAQTENGEAVRHEFEVEVLDIYEY